MRRMLRHREKIISIQQKKSTQQKEKAYQFQDRIGVDAQASEFLELIHPVEELTVEKIHEMLSEQAFAETEKKPDDETSEALYQRICPRS